MERILRLGDVGLDVRHLQQQLNHHGATPRLTEDGHFGPLTEAAVRVAQRRFGLVVDGIAGPKTLATLAAGDRPANLLTEGDLERAAAALDVPLAAVKAVNEVESRGLGFLADGRPVILFERHIMHRRLALAGIAPDVYVDSMPQIVNTRRGGYLGGAAEHRRLDQARTLHAPSAIESASWGLFQIMGFHWELLGYDSAAQYEACMRHSEGKQLDAFVRFIIANPNLHTALRDRKWARFAAGYNGPAYKDNNYDVRLARAYSRHAANLETV